MLFSFKCPIFKCIQRSINVRIGAPYLGGPGGGVGDGFGEGDRAADVELQQEPGRVGHRVTVVSINNIHQSVMCRH